MKVRYKAHPSDDCCSSSFNVSAMSEVIVMGDWGADSAFIKDLDVQLPSGEWKDMSQAFKDKDIVPDNYNEHFSVPVNEECKQRGYNP